MVAAPISNLWPTLPDGGPETRRLKKITEEITGVNNIKYLLPYPDGYPRALVIFL